MVRYLKGPSERSKSQAYYNVALRGSVYFFWQNLVEKVTAKKIELNSIVLTLINQPDSRVTHRRQVLHC